MSRTSPFRVIVVSALLATAGLGLIAPTGNAAASHKTAFACVAANSGPCSATANLSAGAVTLSFQITNTSSGPQAVPFGSFQLHVPSGISICSTMLTGPASFNLPPALSPTPTPNTCGAVNTITVTTNGPTGSGVGAGKTATLTVNGVASTGVCPGTWLLEVKQSNDFSGTGNDFVTNNVSTPVSGGDHLSWTTQPTDVQVNNAVTPSPTVTVLDGCGNVDTSLDPLTVTASDTPTDPKRADPTTPAPTFTAQTINGVATFSSTVDGGTNNDVKYTSYGYDHTLVASAPGTTQCATSGPCYSSSFHVYQLLKVCSTNGKTDCAVSGLTNDPADPFTSVNIDAAAGTSAATLTADVYPNGAGPDDFGTCGQPATSTEPQIGSEVVLNVDRTKTVTIELTKDLVNSIPNNGTPFMDICLDVGGTTTSFTDKFGHSVPRVDNGVTVTAGLLPDCSVTGNVAPCISKRYKQAANEFMVFTLPQGDPKTTPY